MVLENAAGLALAKHGGYSCVSFGEVTGVLAGPEAGVHFEPQPFQELPVAELRRLLAPCVGCRIVGQEELSTPSGIYPAELPPGRGCLLSSRRIKVHC